MAFATHAGYKPWACQVRRPQTKGKVERSLEHRTRPAKFRDSAALESFDWSFNANTIARGPLEELALGEFLARGDNIALVGKSGLGKSHLIQVIG